MYVYVMCTWRMYAVPVHSHAHIDTCKEEKGGKGRGGEITEEKRGEERT